MKKNKTLSDLKRCVEAMQYAVSDIRDVNCGGCGVFAAMAANRLRKLGYEVSTRIIVDDYDRPSKATEKLHSAIFERGVRCLTGLNNAGIFVWHIIVEVSLDGKFYHFDSEYFQEAGEEFDGLDVLEVPIPLDVVMSFARHRYGWNRRFDRGNISRIARNMNQYLTELAGA